MKTLIKFSFSRFAESYDREAVLQKKAAQILLDFAGKLGGKGLDIGCGTGFLVRLSEYKNIVGIDISEEMVRFYRKYNRKAVIGNMEELPFKERSFDFVLSNFSMHWADLNKTVSEVNRVLTEGGLFVFNIPVDGSMEFVEQLLESRKFDFPCTFDVLERLKEEEFIIEDFFIENIQKEFPDGYSLLVHLHRTGVAINPKNQSVGEKRKIVQKFKNYTNTANLNFKLMFVCCKKHHRTIKETRIFS